MAAAAPAVFDTCEKWPKLCAFLAMFAMGVWVLWMVGVFYFIPRGLINIACWMWEGEEDEAMEWKWFEWWGPNWPWPSWWPEILKKPFPWFVDDVTQCSIKCDNSSYCNNQGEAETTDDFYPDCKCACDTGYSGLKCEIGPVTAPSPGPATPGPATRGPTTPGPATPGPTTPGPPPGPPLPLCKANGLTHTGGGGCPAQAFGAKCSSYYDPVGSVLCKQTPGGKQRCMAGERCALPPRCQCTTPAGSDGVNSPTDCKEPATGNIKYRRNLNLCTSKLSQSACENPQFPPAPGTCQWVDQDDRYLY